MMVLQNEITLLQRRMLDLGGLVESAVTRAIRAIETCDIRLARRIEEEDADIDAGEVALEEACLKVLALHQPVAVDLRRIVAVLKINNDLERIGDYAVAIARRTRAGCGAPPREMAELADCATHMVGEALDAVVRMDREAALGLCRKEDAFKQTHDRLQQALAAELCSTRDAGTVARALDFVAIGRALQRICDHATNIAEDLLYIIDGVVVRHKNKEATP